MNGRLCYCNSMGRWSEGSCQMIGRRQTCQPGQIIWEECSQCICQENGKLLCTNTECSEDTTKKNKSNLEEGTELWCTPFRSYYINCSLCVCPASGKMSEARCATDSSCSLNGPILSLDMIKQNICIPKVMYLFSCLHCLCSDEGLFIQSKCVETCHKLPKSARTCIPRTFYRVNCNVYRCPENGIPDETTRSKSICNKKINPLTSLVSLRNITMPCTPNIYTKPKCIYCECNSQGVMNESNCLEQECLKIQDFKYDSVKSSCSPGEMVPTCMECFCLQNGFTTEKYCTRVCSLQNKLIMLERVLKETINSVDRNTIKEVISSDTCEPNSLILDQGRYCLCPENGNANLKLCTSVTDNSVGPKKSQRIMLDKASVIDYNVSCEPNTFVEFGCNTCYCTKDGKINAKWCTFDDCEAKNTIQESHKKNGALLKAELMPTCTAGSITKVDCNFCICGASGLEKNRSCTNNTCSDKYKSIGNEFACEPSAYYTVDCNICFCGTDGIKNVNKCTKNQCETNFLRSDSCSPGSLFSVDCNICVCPPNGNKKDKVCTNRTCAESDTPWKKIFKLSQTLASNHVMEGSTKNLELCFPGEEFESDCKMCVCPDMGLRQYATCTPTSCDKSKIVSTFKPLSRMSGNHSEGIFGNYFNGADTDIGLDDEVRDVDDGEAGQLKGTDRDEDEMEAINTRREICITYNITDSSERQTCTPGAQYIIRCRVCICPYMGNINYFCRPMPPNQHCEQAFPNFNYVPMGRRVANGNATVNGTTKKYPYQVTIPHNHTMHRCEEPGQLTDDCYICECESDKILVEEHCYKSEDEACVNATPSFINAGEHPIYVKKYNKSKITSSVDNIQHPIKPCHIGDVVENECNRCTCSSKTVFECKVLNCKKNSTTKTDLDNVKQFCYPNQLYVQDLMTCICTKDGRWPHKSCHKAFQVLAPEKIKTHKCKPDSYVRVDCNVCRCGPDGQIINDRCTRNACEDDGFRRNSLKSNNVFSKCEVRNWYSLAPCQFCFCVRENKLICNTGSDYSKNIQVGSYNLKICGNDFIREALELIPDNERLLRLRLALANPNISSLQPPIVNTVVTSESTPNSVQLNNEQNNEVELNREGNESKIPYLSLAGDSNTSSSDEYYSDTEEEVLDQKSHLEQTTKKVVTTAKPAKTEQVQSPGRFTKFPFQDGDDINEGGTEESSEDDSINMKAVVDRFPESTLLTPRSAPIIPAAHLEDDKSLKDIDNGLKSPEYQYVDDKTKINLPSVLNKVLQMALRKSMVSLKRGSKCKPGTTTINDCNSCFCLKNKTENVEVGRCQVNTIALNDCNWCSCNKKMSYTCIARPCSSVDMFGHFNDAIKDMDVGMEGHGVWRSDETACEAGVHYKKNDLLCVCTDDGKWPNPVCRDVFQILHAVEETEHKLPSKGIRCSATKLYLFDCNVCFCPSTGRINPRYCTKRQCHKENIARSDNKEIIEEVYATCTPSKQYRLGCQTCLCLRNNRLLCDNCTSEENHNLVTTHNTICNQKKPGEIFIKDCNFCYCNRENIYCTAKKCLQNHTKISLPQIQYNVVEYIQDEYNCIPGSKYKKDCNTCYCFMHEGVKYFGCSMNPCNELSDDHDTDACVEGTSYEANCLICHCVVENGEKREYCHIDDSCKNEENIAEPRPLASMHGYCEPLHVYQQDCNKCRCLADGKTVVCTSNICSKTQSKNKYIIPHPESYLTSKTREDSQEKSVVIELIPFFQKDNFCPRGHTYKVDCNICYCMKNGNAVCTTKQC
ncbi:hypothetical protein HW555_003246 [Spodoptera exigua]|uniref:Pacifastin domain-containing protein n=1 Tax=Spodoptera exigua TaxID=7107 RepID=A0A835L760_SPOEX|nr:hypothetical protein HW555_003246 [Spodoptera exigua]